ncbi:MAG TPA: RNA polymerase factor sigma-54, partial [Oligoflexia bacterium]|nr:RNA polymerase factor sigma-54 [Oligoflexia bacterium]
EGLTSHLLWQLRTGDLSEADKDIAAHIIGNLDRNGYLCSSVDEIAHSCVQPLEDVDRVLAMVQTLDPPGIAARDLRECLLIQLDQLGFVGTLAWRIVAEHLGDLEVRRYDSIARKEHVPVEDVYEAVKEIQKLEPRPGRPFVDEAPIYITPDVYVRKIDSDYVITLNETGIPKLRLSAHYRELLSGAGDNSLVDKEYLQDRLRCASWLIRSIHQRQQTIYRVTESIMKFQREFLELGVSALKPLVLRDIAADVGMHESTVSRVTTNKYVHTPQGVFELKFFFSSGVRGAEGEVSSESVKERIRELISKENPLKPLSDQAIVKLLRDEGVDIARRTVAKYREMMGILSSSRRKKIF